MQVNTEMTFQLMGLLGQSRALGTGVAASASLLAGRSARGRPEDPPCAGSILGTTYRLQASGASG